MRTRTKGRAAWLITVDNMGFEHWGGEHGKVVAVLPSRMTMDRVKDIAWALWNSQPGYDVADRVFYGLDKAERDKKFTKVDSDAFHFGFKPFFHARKVTNLRCVVKDGICTARWRETPRFRFDARTCTSTLERGPVDGMWTEPET